MSAQLALFEQPGGVVNACGTCGELVCADGYADGCPSWQGPAQWAYLAQLAHEKVAHPGVGIHARKWAHLSLISGYWPNKRTEPLEWADKQTSTHDWRTALCLAMGCTVDEIHPVTGHDMRRAS